MVRSTWSVALVVCVVLVIFSSLCQGLTQREKDIIQKGADLGIAMADSLKSPDFQKTLTTVAKNLVPYLGTISPLIGLVLSFIPTESAELRKLKAMANHIDDRFDEVGKKLEELKNIIVDNNLAINYGKIENNIITLENKYEEIYELSPVYANWRKNNFIYETKQNYQLSGEKLYNAFMSKHSVFSTTIRKMALRYDRRKTQSFLKGVLCLLTRAIRIEVALEVAQRRTAEPVIQTWEKRMREVVAICRSIDREVADNYLTKSKSVAIEFANTRSNEGLSHYAFASKLHDLLKAKFYWRNWLVVVYDPILGCKYHRLTEQGGHVLFEQNGRNIVISSIDENAFTPNRGRSSMDTVGVRGGGWWSSGIRKAIDIYNDLDTSNVWVAGVIKSTDVAYAYDDQDQRGFRHVVRPKGKIYEMYRLQMHIYMWG